ncbi:conserved phage C-terminal domain-containing protein [Ligilactobacillus salivarius]|uniref:conserved phage C-terminal domain-containing protein n=1 Tax=Ligilactobacillus salivarius TaxID=1624 RepID=UPI002B4774EE|nr:conserved phage C-terminal domain-containing protein [Ligilactobacillus salivarius]
MNKASGYYKIIPDYVMFDKELLDIPKSILLYGEISALCNSKGYCWASNAYFAEKFKTTERTIIRYINKLVDKKYIAKKTIYKDGSKEVEKRILSIDFRPSDIDDTTGGDTDVTTPGDTDVTDNNVNINNINNNSDDVKKNNKYNFNYKKFFDFFKETTGKKYTATNNNKKLINARLNEGATKQDFYLITKHKAIQWKDSEKMNNWLKPNTIFSSKHFEDYLNEAEAYFSAEPQKKKEESSAKEEKRKVDPIDEQIHRGKLFLEKFPDNEKVRKEIERLERNRNENRGDTAQ